MNNTANSPTLTNCSFLNNSASVGGGMFNFINSPTLTNCSFLNNSASGSGGGMYNASSSSPTLTNCVIFGNNSQNSITNDNGGTLTANYSLFEASETNYTGSNNLTTMVNPFVSTTSAELRQCSPAINAGNNDANNTATDLAGNPRKVGIIDMGAYEFQGSLPSITASLSGTATICAGASTNLSATLTGGTSPYTLVYSVSGGNNQTIGNYASGTAIAVSPNSTTTYVVVSASDANGCTATVSGGSATVTVKPAPSAPTLDASPGNTTTNQPIIVTASGCDNGTIAWNPGNGTGTANGNQYTFSQPGGYTLSATCTVEGCTSPASAPLNLTINACAVTLGTPQITSVSCNGASDGAISVTASGGMGYTYTLSPGNVSNGSVTFSGLAAGEYSITVNDANNCSAGTGTVTITEPATLTTSVTAQTNADCNGASTGSITLTASGGTGNIGFSLTGTNNNAYVSLDGSFAGLPADTYIATATDANNCTANSGNIVITEPAPITVSISGNTKVMFGFGENCTTLTANASGGTGPYSYAWNNGANPANAASTQVCPGQSSQTYTVTVTDGNGCQQTETATVTVNDVSCGNRSQDVTICYYGVTQCVSEKMAARYIKLGAIVGGCNGGGSARIGVPESGELSTGIYLIRVRDRAYRQAVVRVSKE